MGSLRRASTIVLLVLGLAVAASACGGDDGGGSGGGAAGSGGNDEPLVVSAATSLNGAFEAYGESVDPTPRFSFAGSDELAAQIRQGVKPDVYAAANTSLPDELFEEDLIEEPVTFTGNQLVLAVPADGSDIESLEDLTADGVTIAIGSESVPVGSYTRDVLGRLPEGEADAILANVRSEEPDVGGVVGKLTQGAVDAAFVYATDVVATQGELRAIDLPEELDPSAAYGVAVVKGAENPERAQEFIDGLLEGAGADALAEAGFDPPPGE